MHLCITLRQVQLLSIWARSDQKGHIQKSILVSYLQRNSSPNPRDRWRKWSRLCDEGAQESVRYRRQRRAYIITFQRFNVEMSMWTWTRIVHSQKMVIIVVLHVCFKHFVRSCRSSASLWCIWSYVYNCTLCSYSCRKKKWSNWCLHEPQNK